jgi:hypothetical protein
MRQSGSALRKLIRSVAAAGFWSGEANGEERFLGTKPELAAPRHRYWDTLLMGPAAAMGERAATLFGERVDFASVAKKLLPVLHGDMPP